MVVFDYSQSKSHGDIDLIPEAETRLIRALSSLKSACFMVDGWMNALRWHAEDNGVEVRDEVEDKERAWLREVESSHVSRQMTSTIDQQHQHPTINNANNKEPGQWLE